MAVLTVVAIAVVSAIGAVGAYGNLASDANTPTTTTDAVAVYWDDAVITVSATDDEGVAYIYHELDNGVVRLHKVDGSPRSAAVETPLNAVGAHVNPGVGTHELTYWAQDVNGNVEAQKTVEFEIVADTVWPVTSAKAVSVRKGRTASLRYRVADPEPTKGTATVVIKIKNKKGKTVKTIKAGSKPVNESLTVKCRCTFAKGVYKYYVYATDASGNPQSKVGSAKITVK